MSKDKVNLKELAEQLVNLSVLEVNELNQILKDEYGIEPQVAPMAVATTVAGGDEDEEDSQSKTVNIVLKDPGSQKVAVIKAIKDVTELPLGEAKALVDNAPKNIKEGVAREEATEIKTKLEEAGATIELV